MFKFVILIMGLLLIFPARAEKIPNGVLQECMAEAERTSTVNIKVNYGKLGLQLVSKAETQRICSGEQVAGCFHRLDSSPIFSGEYKVVNVGNYTCLIPHYYLKFDFSGRYITLSNEYFGCDGRAVLRHELQHFTIWKTAKEQMLYEIKNILYQQSLNETRACKNECHLYNLDIQKDYNTIISIFKKWSAINSAEDNRLDEVDHDMEREVNYRVCAPYSLKVSIIQ